MCDLHRQTIEQFVPTTASSDAAAVNVMQSQGTFCSELKKVLGHSNA